MRRLKLTKPVLLVMGKTGSIGGTGKTNQKQTNKKDMKTIEEEEDNILDNEDDQLEDGAMYPTGLEMEGDDNDNARDIKDDNDNDSPLDRDDIFIGKDDNAMYPVGLDVK